MTLAVLVLVAVTLAALYVASEGTVFHRVAEWTGLVWGALAGVYVPPGQRRLPSGSASATTGSPHPENDEDDPWLRGGLVTHAETLQTLPREVQLGLLAARVHGMALQLNEAHDQAVADAAGAELADRNTAIADVVARAAARTGGRGVAAERIEIRAANGASVWLTGPQR